MKIINPIALFLFLYKKQISIASFSWQDLNKVSCIYNMPTFYTYSFNVKDKIDSSVDNDRVYCKTYVTHPFHLNCNFSLLKHGLVSTFSLKLYFYLTL